MIRNLILISLAWSVFILFISGIPGDSIPKTTFSNIPHFDKIVHMGLYFPLGFFLMAEFKLSKVKWLNRLAILLTLFLVALYGGLIELGQDYLFSQRSADWYDFFADLAGGLLGILFYYLVSPFLFKSRLR